MTFESGDRAADHAQRHGFRRPRDAQSSSGRRERGDQGASGPQVVVSGGRAPGAASGGGRRRQAGPWGEHPIPPAGFTAGARGCWGDRMKANTCGAKTRHGTRCRGLAMKNGRCRMHGGSSLAGIASPSFKDGRRSKYLAPTPWHPGVTLPPGESAPDRADGRTRARRRDAPGCARSRESGQSGSRPRCGRNFGELLDRRGRLVSVESRRRKDEHDLVERSEFARFAKVFLLQMREHVLTLALDPTVARALMMKIQEDALRLLTISQGPAREDDPDPTVH